MCDTKKCCQCHGVDDRVTARVYLLGQVLRGLLCRPEDWGIFDSDAPAWTLGVSAVDIVGMTLDEMEDRRRKETQEDERGESDKSDQVEEQPTIYCRWEPCLGKAVEGSTMCERHSEKFVSIALCLKALARGDFQETRLDIVERVLEEVGVLRRRDDDETQERESDKPDQVEEPSPVCQWMGCERTLVEMFDEGIMLCGEHYEKTRKAIKREYDYSSAPWNLCQPSVLRVLKHAGVLQEVDNEIQAKQTDE